MPGSEPVSQAQVAAEMARYDINSFEALTENSVAVRLAVKALEAINEGDKTQYLVWLARSGLIRAGPVEGFLAANLTIDDQEYIILSNQHPTYTTTQEMALSLVREIGAVQGLSHKRNLAREATAKEWMNAAVDPFSSILVVADKDGTLTPTSEPVDNDMVSRIIELLRKRIHFMVLTGAILELGLTNFIEPIERAAREAQLTDRLVYFRYYFSSGNGHLTWTDAGERERHLADDRYSPEELRRAAAAAALAFVDAAKVVAPELEVEPFRSEMSAAVTIASVQGVFHQFVAANSGILGRPRIDNGDDRKVTLELKASKDERAATRWINAEFMTNVFERFVRNIEEQGGLRMPLLMYGPTYLDIGLRDKLMTFREIIAEPMFSNPLVFTMGDSNNDHAFMDATIQKGVKINIYVGDSDHKPENAFVWPVHGPRGSMEAIDQLIVPALGMPEEEVLQHAVRVLAERKRQISSSPLGREEAGASPSTTLGASSPVIGMEKKE
ncbi:MAG: hypothetical protein AAB356_05635, partial [Deltaproteobacteria bacterium]